MGEYVLLSTAQYNSLKRSRHESESAAPPTEPEAAPHRDACDTLCEDTVNVDTLCEEPADSRRKKPLPTAGDGSYGEVIARFPGKLQNAARALVGELKKSDHIQLEGETLKVTESGHTYNLHQLLKVCLYKHESFSTIDYSPLKSLFKTFNFAYERVLNDDFKRFLTYNSKARWTSYNEVFKKASKKSVKKGP